MRQPAPRSVCPAAAAVSTICSMLIPGGKAKGYSSLPTRIRCGRHRRDSPRVGTHAAVPMIYATPIPGYKRKDSIHATYARSACPAAPGNPRRGFPTIKQSAGLFYLPSCAFHRNEISPCAHGDQRRRLWIGPPLKRRAKLHFRAGSLQKHSAFLPDRNIHQS